MPSKRLATLLSHLNQRFEDVGYNCGGIRRRLGFTYPDEVSPWRRAALVERERTEADPLAALVLAFWLEAEVPVRQLRSALGGALYEESCRRGLLQVRAHKAVATLRAEPVGEFLVWADRRFEPSTSGPRGLPRGDVVYPPSADSLILAEAISFAPGSEVLDLCTGSGVLALHVAGTARRVHAIDLSPRAVALAGLNAEACGRDNICLHLGDLYTPVRQQAFDAIVTNPPFVPSPFRDGPRYHSGGSRGDRVLKRAIQGWKQHLRWGGRAFAVAHLALRAKETLGDAASRWLARFDGRAFVIELDRGPWYEFAAAQAMYALRQGVSRYNAEVARWAAFVRRQRILEVVAFLVVGERTGRYALDVESAAPRLLPIPLHKTPSQLLNQWWQAGPGT